MPIDNSRRPRSVLKGYFAKNAIPTDTQFAELIDGGLNQRDDGVYKAAGDPLSIEAAGDEAGMKRAVAFWSAFADPNPAWTIALKPRRVAADPATARPGWSVLDAAGTPRLTIDAANGNVGAGTIQPRERLDVDGRVAAGPMTMGAWIPDGSYAAIGTNALDQGKRENFALLQQANGTTFLNSTAALSLQIRNSDRVVISDADVALTRPLRLFGLTVGPWPVNAGYMHVGLNGLDQRQPGNYALLVGDGAERGATFVNSPVKVNLRIANNDRLVVEDAAVTVARTLRVAGPLVPSAGNGAGAGISFPDNPGGGGGDGAWIRYYARSGEATTLEIGTSNDPDDHIALMSQNGNVGVGVLDPTSKLDVNGDTLVRGTLRVNGEASFDKGLKLASVSGGGAPLKVVGDLKVTGAEAVVDGTLRAGKIAGTGATLAVAAPVDLQQDVAVGGKHALRGNDGWLRLNQDKQFPLGVHTPGLMAPVSLNVGGLDSWNDPGAGNIGYAGRLNKLDVMPQQQAFLPCGELIMGGTKIAGRKGTTGRALADTADKLIVNLGGDWPSLELQGRAVTVTGALTPSAGTGPTAGIVFPRDPFGGSGDNAWIQYITRGGEATTLEIGTSNDPDDHIALMPSGSVGIGTQAPTRKLDVNGDVALKGKLAISGGAPGDEWMRLNQDGQFKNGVHVACLLAPVSINVGAYNGWEYNPGSGNIVAAGDVISRGSVLRSSIHLKKNVRSISSARAAAIVDGLEPVSFEWKEDGDDATEHLGFIAQHSPKEVTPSGREAIALAPIVAALTRVVRDQTVTMAALHDRLGRLEARA